MYTTGGFEGFFDRCSIETIYKFYFYNKGVGDILFLSKRMAFLAFLFEGFGGKRIVDLIKEYFNNNFILKRIADDCVVLDDKCEIQWQKIESLF